MTKPKKQRPFRRAVATESTVRRELADLQQMLGVTTPETFVHFEGEAPRKCDPNGTRKLPIAGDLVIFFPSLESPYRGADRSLPEGATAARVALPS